ncbi:hypothetical protein [Mesomycoplasma neurolyticum]|uniref:Uncharacterized protein n=1 Tax=Mesomycoplasma neurolyticum TaxID=2120 RepID=A0A449A6L0_9BACT|nr:hypothetical protein [Mesomycoplasma neurolyticum]VEU59920.1 Uncharacterised protein [Mesomycoplasma neurolyticum]
MILLTKNKIVLKHEWFIFCFKNCWSNYILNWINEKNANSYVKEVSDLLIYLEDAPYYSTVREAMSLLIEKSNLRKAKIAIDFAVKKSTLMKQLMQKYFK